MTKETLMEWGLTEEQAEKVMGGLDGAFVTKARFNELNEENKALKAQVKERDGQMEALKKSAGDSTELQKQIAALQEENRQKEQAHAEEMKRLRVDTAVELALSAAKAKNVKAAKALLALDTAELSEDGTVKGLAEQIQKLVKAPDSSFLFDTAAGVKFKGARAAEKGDPREEGTMTLEALRKMSPAERYSYSVNNPEEYKKLYGGKET